MDIYKNYRRDELRGRLAKLEKEMVDILSGKKKFLKLDQKQKVVNELQTEMGKIQKELSGV